MNQIDLIKVPGTPVDPSILDHLQKCLANPNSEISCEYANELLTAFTERADSYLFTGQIIASNCTLQTKFCALCALAKAVHTSWKIIDIQNQSSIKSFLIDLIYNDVTPEPIVNKCVSIIVAILNYEYPVIWSNFTDIILAQAKESTTKGRKTLELLSFFAEFIEEGSDNSVTSIRSQQMTNALQRNFDQIYALIQSGLENTNDILFVKSAIKSLGQFIPYFNPEHFVQSNLISKLCSAFLADSSLIVPVLTVLTESIAHLNLPSEMQNSIPMYFDIVITTLTRTLDTNNESLLNDISFANSFITALTTFVVQYGHLADSVTQKTDYSRALQWTFKITESSQQPLYGDCIEFWVSVCRRVLLNGGSNHPSFQIYAPFVPLLRRLLISRMPPPYEIEVSIDEFGCKHNIVKNNMGLASFYATVRECLVFLTHFGYEDTLNAFSEIMHNMFNESPSEEPEVGEVLKLCWAFGAVSGSFTDSVEDQFLPNMIIGLFRICDKCSDTLARTEIACAISFMCSQYYKFLQKFWVVMHAVFQKIVQFLKECEPQYQGLIIESLMQLAMRSRAQFALLHDQENVTLLDEIMENAAAIIEPLTVDSMAPMFDVFSIMIQGITAEDSRAMYVQKIIASLENRWAQITSQLNPYDLHSNIHITLILHCHAAIPSHLSGTYFDYFKKWVPNLIQIYNAMTQSLAAQECPNDVLRSIIEVKSAVVNLFYRTTYLCSKTEMIEGVIFEPALTVLIDDFMNSPPIAKLPITLKLFNAIFSRCTEDVMKHLPIIFAKLYRPGLSLIEGDNQDINDEFLIEFFAFLTTLCQYASSELLMKLNEPDLNTFIETLKWGCQCLHRNVSEISFNALHTLFTSIERSVPQDVSHKFCEKYIVSFFEFSFKIMSDITYKYTFHSQVNLLRKIISIPESQAHASDLGQVLLNFFPNRLPSELGEFVVNLYQNEGNYQNFRIILKNFFCTICQISQNDPDLIAEEKREMLEALRDQFKGVPGYISASTSYEEFEVDENIANLPQSVNELSIREPM